MAEEETISWFAGVDWGSEKHHVCLLDAQGTIAGEREFPHSGEGWQSWVTGFSQWQAGQIRSPWQSKYRTDLSSMR